MSDTTIRDFFVSLGYDIDKSSERSFNDSLKRTAENAAKLGLAIEAAAASLTAAVVKMAQGMEQSYYASKRLGASVTEINAVSHALTQVGGNADAAKQSMENIAAFMRRLPAGKNYIQGLIGKDFNANDTTQIMAGLSKKFASMGYAHAKVLSEKLGIDENTLQAMLRDGGKYYEEYQSLVKKAGVDQDAYAKNSQELMQKVRSLGASFAVLSDKIGAELIKKAGPYVERFKTWMDNNFDEITNVIVRVSDVVMRLSDRLHQVANDLMEWYRKLDPQAKSLVKTITAVAGALYLLNRGFLATPLGRIFAIGAGIMLLYDDYRKWKESGEKGLIDWEKWEPAIEATIEALRDISRWISKLVGNEDGSIASLQTAFELFAAYMATKWLASFIGTMGKAVGATNLLISGVQLAIMGSVAAGVSTAHSLKTGSYAVDPNTGGLVPVAGAGQYHEPYVDPRGGGFGKLGVWWKQTMPGWLGGGSVKSGGGGGHTHTAGGEELAPITTPSGKTVMVSKQHQEQFQGFVTELEEQGYKINSLGGYANRQNVNNPNRKSEHAHGNAIDINPAQNPNGRTLVTDMPDNISQLAKKWGLGWGGDWKSVKDAMHFSAGEREGGRTLSPQELAALQKGRQKKQAQANIADLVKKAASLPNLPAVQNGGIQAPGANAAPLLPSQVSNAATLNQKTEINIMGNADANQVAAAQNTVNQNGVRNMMTAIR